MADERENLAEAERRVRHFAGLTDAGDWGYVATIMDEYDKRGAEWDEALGLLRELVELENEPHPHGHSSEECDAWQDEYWGRHDGSWAKAEALVERTSQGGQT